MTTGKNKENFEKWLLERRTKGNSTLTYDWQQLTTVFDFDMQIGVYEAFYDSLDNMTIEINRCPSSGMWYFMINDSSDEFDENNTFKRRPAAQKEALKQADRLRNEQLNK